MAHYKNFVTASLPASGLLIPAGTTSHDVIIAIAGALTLASGGQWAEVTGAGPTPAALQPFASTGITAGGTTLQGSSGTMRHVTMYDTLDPALAEATPRARMIRFAPSNHGITIALLDLQAFQGAVTNDDAWTAMGCSQSPSPTALYMSKHNTLGSSANRSNQFFAFMPAGGSTTPSNTTSTLTDQRVYIVGDDDWVYIRTERVSNGNFAGEAYIQLPTPPADGHWTRVTRPCIFGWRPSGDITDGSASADGTNSEVWAPGITANGWAYLEGEHTIASPFGHYPDHLAPDGSLILARPINVFEGTTLPASAYIGAMPGIYRSVPHASVGKWNTTTIATKEYCVMAINGVALWVQTS